MKIIAIICLLQSLAFISNAQTNNAYWFAKIKPAQQVKMFSLKPLIQTSSTSYTIIKPIADNDFLRTYGAICKWEHKLQKTIKVPFYFRLGSLQYTNFLEGKNNLYRFHQ
jgi:hypothetical protein